nr:zinc finger, CCHC-type [Tanacetum cinerariifolium]
MPEDSENGTMRKIRKKSKWGNDDYVCHGIILSDFKHTLKHQMKELTLVELGSHMWIKKSLRVQDSDKPKGNNVAGLLVVNMVDHNNSTRYTDNRGKPKHQDNTKADPSKKSKLTWIDYFDTYALVAQISTIRPMIALASIHNLIIHQMDLKTTFLNVEMDEELYMNQPYGFIMPGNENKECKLIKSLYGMKHEPKQ